MMAMLEPKKRKKQDREIHRSELPAGREVTV
jgi:hypothetical protein